MNHEKFQLKIQAIPNNELVAMANLAITKLCKTGARSFTMSVPPRIDDTDMILTEVVRRVMDIEKLEEKLGSMLKENKGVFASYQSDISAEFKNECNRFMKIKNSQILNVAELDTIAHNGAKNFLNKFIQNLK